MGRKHSRMQRCLVKYWIADLLVLVMLVPAFGPLALLHAAPIENMHCARRPLAPSRASEPAMHCHEGLAQNAANGGPGASEAEASFRSLDCCSGHDCCRSVKTSEWARPASNLLSILSFLVESSVPSQNAADVRAAFVGPDSARAPPLR